LTNFHLFYGTAAGGTCSDSLETDHSWSVAKLGESTTESQTLLSGSDAVLSFQVAPAFVLT